MTIFLVNPLDSRTRDNYNVQSDNYFQPEPYAPESGPYQPESEPYVVPVESDRRDDEYEDYGADMHSPGYPEHMRWKRSLSRIAKTKP